jgi:exopolyphosphatase/guanosine-5'-triphosphate,3'-diphosphate pyrophosphatase
VRDRIGAEPDVVSGDGEAALSFDGATRELRGTAALAAPYLVVDIGGGSTELVLGDDSGPRASASIDIGCVRMTERHLHDDPPTAAQVRDALADVNAALDQAATTVPLHEARTLVGLAGTVTTVVALAIGLESYDPVRIHYARVPSADVAALAARLLAMTHDERAALPVMHPGRVDVIGGGALILDAVTRHVGLDAVVASEHDILDGIAWSISG